MTFRPPQPGELIHCLGIDHKVVTGQDGHGQDIYTWQEQTRAYGRVEPLQGRDVEYAKQLYHLATLRVTLRYTDKLTTTSQFTFGDRILSVGYVLNLEERCEWMQALCSEGAE